MQLKEKESIKVIKYSKHEIKNFKNGKVVVAINEKIIDKFIEDSIKYSSNKKLYFGKINKELANRIKNNIGINLNEYNISLKCDSIRHILKHHSNENEILIGQVPVVKDDFKLLSIVISNFDEIYESGLSKDEKLSITFRKNIGNDYYLINYISDKRKSLELQTVYKINAMKKNSATESDAKSSN